MEKETDIILDGSPTPSDHESFFGSFTTTPVTLPSSSSFTIITPNQSCSARQSGPSLDSIFSQLELVEKPPLTMFTALGTIFQHAIRGEQAIDLGVRDWWSVLRHADEASGRGLTDAGALTLIETILEHLWSNGPEDDLVNAARILADACREPGWRIPFRQAGILDFFLEVIAAGDVELKLISQTLRLIGNACADTDTNRERVISQESLPSIIEYLQHDTVANLVIPVLYNICVDYEPAQEAVRTNKLCPRIVNLLARESFDSQPLLGYICPLLNFSIEEFDTSESPDYSVRVLLETASGSDVEVEDLVTLVQATVIHLKLERFQRIFIAQDLIKLALFIIIRSFSPQTPSSDSLSILDLTPLVRDPEEEAQLSEVRSSLIRALSDVSAIPEFGVQYSVNSELVESLIRWLPASRTDFQICSSIMLGNLARSDTVCHSMVHDLRVHEVLAAIIRESSDLQVLHAALGFLRNLALPLANKFLLGEAQIVEVVSRFWAMDYSPQLQYAAVSLLRQLLNKSLANVERILNSLSLDPDSPAHEKTHLSLLLSFFDKTDQEPTKVEIARAMAAIWRCLNITDPSNEPNVVSHLLHRLYSMHANIAKPLATMVTQSRWQIIQSEGWFALALMARSHEGSVAVNVILQEVEVFGALVETVTGQSIAAGTEEVRNVVDADIDISSLERNVETGSDSETEIRARNRENAMVLVYELLKNSGDDMSIIRRNLLEDLLRGRQSNLSFQELMLRGRSLE